MQDLKIVDVTTGKNRLGTQFINISWMAKNSFGEYIFYKGRKDKNWQIDTGHVDKEFGRKLLTLWLNGCDVR